MPKHLSSFNLNILFQLFLQGKPLFCKMWLIQLLSQSPRGYFGVVMALQYSKEVFIRVHTPSVSLVCTVGPQVMLLQKFLCPLDKGPCWQLLGARHEAWGLQTGPASSVACCFMMQKCVEMQPPATIETHSQALLPPSTAPFQIQAKMYFFFIKIFLSDTLSEDEKSK